MIVKVLSKLQNPNNMKFVSQNYICQLDILLE